MGNAHANRHGHIKGCAMCEGTVKPYPSGHKKGKSKKGKGGKKEKD